MKQSKEKKAGKVEEALGNSFINYFSDLFVCVMVIAWIAAIVIMLPFCIYSTIALCDTSIWSYLVELVSIPLTAGGAIWMVKNAVQHAIANNKGERAHMDFPKVPDTEDIELETAMKADRTGQKGNEQEIDPAKAVG